MFLEAIRERFSCEIISLSCFSMCVIFFPLLKAYDMIMNKLDIQIVTQVARMLLFYHTLQYLDLGPGVLKMFVDYIVKQK